jgi:hypothetical protein
MFMKWPGVTAEQYDALREKVLWEDNPPPGVLFHVATFEPQGIRVFDMWETAEEFDSFINERLMPAVQELGVPGEPEVDICEVHATFTPAFQPVA